MEYGVILLLLKKRLKPRYTISFGLRRMFHNGEASAQPQAQPPQQQVKKRKSPGSPAGNPATTLVMGDNEELKPLVPIYFRI